MELARNSLLIALNLTEQRALRMRAIQSRKEKKAGEARKR